MILNSHTEMTKKLETTNEIDVDDAVTASAPLYRYSKRSLLAFYIQMWE